MVHVCANEKHRLPLGRLLRMLLPPLSKGTEAAWDICAGSDLEKDSAPRKNLSPTPEAHQDGNRGNRGYGAMHCIRETRIFMNFMMDEDQANLS